MSKVPKNVQATSTELTGGAGFSYEDTVVAYYLAALLREGGAALQTGVVKSVAVQQSGHGKPMDDMVVEFDDQGTLVSLDLQIKTAIAISSRNASFQDVVVRALQTRAMVDFSQRANLYGFAVERVSIDGLQSLERLIEWAKASPEASHFTKRFLSGGSAAKAEREMRDDLIALIKPSDDEDEWTFYRRLVGTRFDGLKDGGPLRTEIITSLQSLISSNEDGQNILLFDRLCRLVRDGAGTARKWTRATLLAQLRGAVHLKVAPSFEADLELLAQFAKAGMEDIADDIEGFRVERSALQHEVNQKLQMHRVVNISGLPGCGKSVVLRRAAAEATQRGPVFFLKADRLPGKSWLEFAATLGLRHRHVADLLAEIGATGSAILYIDGIDRINPDQKRIILDLLHAIGSNVSLDDWRVLATSRDQGLETYRAWFPSSFYNGLPIGDIKVQPFSDEEAAALAKEKPSLRHLLMGAPAVRDIARRPFFAAVLASTFDDNTGELQTETDLIHAWWARAGHDTLPEARIQRQRALLDLAEKGVSSLGKNIVARRLAAPTFEHVSGLKQDLIVRGHDYDASFSFTHDIFFEWAFFRLLIDLGDEWIQGLADAGEPPLLGRVVGLLAQHSLTTPEKWSERYRALERSALRSQWRREWLTAPPFTSMFTSSLPEFTRLTTGGDCALLEKTLMWFQAQHTVPSPLVLRQPDTVISDVAGRLRLADVLSWPSDFVSWGRLLDWLFTLIASIPVRLMPLVVDVFSVWQNALYELRNPRSTRIVETCSGWLAEVESAIYHDVYTADRGKWSSLGSDALATFASSLRVVIVRAARVDPSYAEQLLNRAISNERMRSAAYTDLMSMSWMLSEVLPDGLAAVAKAEILEDLPNEKADRQRRREEAWAERARLIRSKPEQDRSEDESGMLQSFHLPLGGMSELDDDLGIDRHHSYYYPISALHEPFASLFAKKPDIALKLVRDISNHATTAWRQFRKLSRRRPGTPIPATINFSWGDQDFWGDWTVYSWHLGQLAAQPLECAFLALSYWAFRQLEAGQPVDDVIRSVVEGNDSLAAAGLGLTLALESFHVSETSLALVACQRLWPHDIHRHAQEPLRDADPFGINHLSRLTGDHAKAKDFLDARESRARDVKELAMRFALSGDKALRESFKRKVLDFPRALPFEFAEQRDNSDIGSALLASANEYVALSDRTNYRGYRVSEDKVMLAYEPPRTPEAIRRSDDALAYLHQQAFLNWAMRSLREFALVPDLQLADAVALAKSLHDSSMFIVRLDVGEHTPQSLVAAVAACVICFGKASSDDYLWATDILSCVETMREPQGFFPGSQLPWHPVLQLIYALLHLRRAQPEDRGSANRLLHLTVHPFDEVANLAFSALFADPLPQVSWAAAQLALELSRYYRPERGRNGEWVSPAGVAAAQEAMERAERALVSDKPTPVGRLPNAWAEQDREDHARDGMPCEPDPAFDARRAEAKVKQFPIEKWCSSPGYLPLIRELLLSLVTWTKARIELRNADENSHGRSSDLMQWNAILGEMLARSAPCLDVTFVKESLLRPFLNGDDALGVISTFSTRTITQYVLDAREIPSGTFELLRVCVERAVTDPMFRPGRYRSGELLGHHMPKLVDSLLVVSVEHAKGAARFVNGNWSEIALIMPLVTRLVTKIGWSSYVMSKFLLLCERAGDAYPVADFIVQSQAVLQDIDKARKSWVGSNLPARTAAIVQRLANVNYPLKGNEAQGLLRVLDLLVDLGDRRSVALEQTEAFKGVQIAADLGT